jgi:hypothetical protein
MPQIKEFELNIVRNLRHRWPDELTPFSDRAILDLYTDFAQSEDYGNNDEKFPEWFDMLATD